MFNTMQKNYHQLFIISQINAIVNYLLLYIYIKLIIILKIEFWLF